MSFFRKDNLIPFFVLVPLTVIVTWYYWPKPQSQEDVFVPIDRATLTEKLNILIWENYIPEDQQANPDGFLNFIYDTIARDYGIDVQVSYFGTNEELYEILSNPKERTKYDVVMPSNFLVSTLVDDGLLEPIIPGNIPNWDGIDGRFRNDHLLQELLQYSVPYIFGVGGIAYNSWHAYEIPLDWGFLLEPGQDLVEIDTERVNYENLDAEIARREAMRARIRFQLKGRISLINDMRTALGSALIYLGYPPNSENPDEINQAADLLIWLVTELDARVDSTDVSDRLISGETHMAMAWSGDAMVAMNQAISNRKDLALDDIDTIRDGQTTLKSTVRDEIPKIRFTSPQPTALAFLDCFAIVRGSSNISNAETFINFMLDPVVAGQVTNFSFYGNTVAASKEFVNRDILNGPPFFLPADDSVALISPVDEDAIMAYQDAWQRVMLAALEQQNVSYQYRR
ncbi:MAG: spermidine/putrescine ABC transporter substrate-binding protein [Opitutales bacterium]|nr:spermidine/putrescine ABC transporter substrate-binding protein [Opitutales bacterium]